ncbi:RNA polymerase subunit sigma-70 [Nocardia asiatica]|uniref:RNA polymerase subunit sigma-70 n=1 Tax=Nocardia asiatica TaxID=209252 RepID=UPI002453EE6C|nr:RNA polymerase subunit sigma-70 [Nocardia asiatica]
MTHPVESATQQFRGELFAYCYKLLGSPHDAEDAVQEVYLLAWRGYDDFEGRASLRTWLYRIATRVCLKAIDRRGRRALPSGLGGPGDPAEPVQPRLRELSWVEPVPDTALDPAAAIESRHATRLAFVAALQHLPGRQRAILVLRDVLMFPAAEVATLLATTTTAVNSALQRARAQLAALATTGYNLSEPTDPWRREVLDRYAIAFQNADIAELVRLLTEDAVLEMPPIPTWFRGRDHVGEFLRSRLTTPGAVRLVPTVANAQPAFGVYLHGHGGVHHPHALQLLTLSELGITRIDMFHDPTLFPLFDLPDLIQKAEQ